MPKRVFAPAAMASGKFEFDALAVSAIVMTTPVKKAKIKPVLCKTSMDITDELLDKAGRIAQVIVMHSTELSLSLPRSQDPTQPHQHLHSEMQ